MSIYDYRDDYYNPKREITAAEARKNTDKTQGSKLASELAPVFEEILEASEAGDSYIYYSKTLLSADGVYHLNKLGYCVFNGPRYYEIYW